MTSLVGDLRFVRWSGGCAFLGTWVAIVPMHSHQAIQVVLTEAGECLLRDSDNSSGLSCGLGIVPSRQPHSLDATSIDLCMVLFVEPETREGRALTESFLADGIAALPRELVASAAEVLFSEFRARRGDPLMANAVQGVVHALTGEVEPAVITDERILRAIDYINGHLDSDVTLDTVAAQVFLSPGRFRHLFVEQTGIGLRPFILWRRLMRSWELAMEGVPLSTAAHQAGFADSSHLARTSKRTIGAAPSGWRMSATPRALGIA
ncbi:MAG: helix-turn-helix domain-containing protein [Gemmatimonadales bacterium]